MKFKEQIVHYCKPRQTLQYVEFKIQTEITQVVHANSHPPNLK